MEAKMSEDPTTTTTEAVKRVWVAGAVVIGAGPSGLAAAACLKQRGIPRVILERAQCVGSLWRDRTYDRLRLHLPKRFCHLPGLPFPSHFPLYPTRAHFIEYLDSYVKHFELRPHLGRAVEWARFDPKCGLWRVRVRVSGPKGREEVVEYVSQWVVVATGENAEAHVPEVEGRGEYEPGRVVIHSCAYRSGSVFEGKKVLVVGCGNSGMEVCLDLCNHNAKPSLVVRDSVHILPQQMLGTSTFGLSMCLLRWFPVKLVDRFLLLMSRFLLGNVDQLGLTRPPVGPLEYKSVSGKTPVLDIGTLAKIKVGEVKVFPAIKRLTRHGAEFVDGRRDDFDAIIFATGYKSNVPSWLKDNTMFSEKDGYPVKPFPNGWKGENGLYAVGFTKHGLLGASLDAIRIAEDIERDWKIKAKQLINKQRLFT